MDTVSSQCCFEQFVYSGLWSVGAEALENSSTFLIQTFIFSINKFSNMVRVHIPEHSSNFLYSNVFTACDKFKLSMLFL